MEPTSPAEIRGFLGHATQALADAAIPAVSASGRFEFAYTAAHALAFAALRANDLRPDAGPGHRIVRIYCVEGPSPIASRLRAARRLFLDQPALGEHRLHRRFAAPE